MAIKLAPIWGVTPDKVLNTPTDLVMAALAYERFKNQYEEKATELSSL